MKKNILIGVLFLVALSSMIYAFIKADEAEKRAWEMVQNKGHVEELRNEVVQLKYHAQQSAAEAEKHRILSQKISADCKSK